MKCVRITIIMKMGLAVVAIITMNTVTSAGMGTAMSRNTSTAMTKRAAAAKFILMKGMNTMPAAVKNMSTIITAVVVGKNTITNISMAKVVVVGNIITMSMMIAAAADMSTTTNISMAKAVAVVNITMNTKKAVAADMNIITATTFRGTRRTVSAKSAIRTKNTAMCAAKALKTAPAACRTLTA